MLINVFDEIINPDNITFLGSETLHQKDGSKSEWATISFTSAENDYVSIKDKTVLEVMEEINRQIKDNK